MLESFGKWFSAVVRLKAKLFDLGKKFWRSSTVHHTENNIQKVKPGGGGDGGSSGEAFHQQGWGNWSGLRVEMYIGPDTGKILEVNLLWSGRLLWSAGVDQNLKSEGLDCLSLMPIYRLSRKMGRKWAVSKCAVLITCWANVTAAKCVFTKTVNIERMNAFCFCLPFYTYCL